MNGTEAAEKLCSPRRRFEEAKSQDQHAADLLDGRAGTPLPLVSIQLQLLKGSW